MVSIRL